MHYKMTQKPYTCINWFKIYSECPPREATAADKYAACDIFSCLIIFNLTHVKILASWSRGGTIEDPRGWLLLNVNVAE